jgi:hypothetical protein
MVCVNRTLHPSLTCNHRDGTVDEVRQEPVPQSSYQEVLEDEVDGDLDSKEDLRSVDLPGPALDGSTVRYWSDYSRVYYTPRSFHMLPDALDFENIDDDWSAGKDTFERYDSVR